MGHVNRRGKVPNIILGAFNIKVTSLPSLSISGWSEEIHNKPSQNRKIKYSDTETKGAVVGHVSVGEKLSLFTSWSSHLGCPMMLNCWLLFEQLPRGEGGVSILYLCTCT